MAIRVPGKKRRVRANFEKIVASISAAGQLAESGDHRTALTRFVEAIESLRSDWCRQSVADGLVADPEWTDQLVAAILGKTRAVAALDSRSVVYEQAEQLMADVFSLRPGWSEARLFM